jgi:PKD repeat protein
MQLTKKLLAFAAVASVPLLSSGISLAADYKDIVPPSDVANVKAVAGVEKVTLTWDAASDNTAVTSYKVYYGTRTVTEEGGWYQEEVLTETADTSFAVKELTAEKKYYFAITALDEAKNESLNYSIEVASTPLSKTTAEESADVLPVTNLLANKTEGAIPLEVSFNGSTSVYTAGEITTYAWDFNADGETDSTEAKPSYTFKNAGITEAKLTVTTNDGKQASATQKITTWENKEVTEVTEEPEIIDPILEETETEEPTVVEPIIDTTAPEALTNVKAKYVTATEGYNVTLTWTASTDETLKEYRIYTMQGDIELPEFMTTAKEETSLLIPGLAGGKNYTFRVAAVDANNNIGTDGKVEVTLPELPDTGPALLVPFALSGLALLGRKTLKKRQ